MKKYLLAGAAIAASYFVMGSALACASCGCSLNSDWSTQGVSNQGGWSLDARYDSLNQNNLWLGTRKIGAAQAAGASNTQTGGFAEVERFTQAQVLTSTLDYNNGERWGVSVSVPMMRRTHSTDGVSSDGVTIDHTHGYDSQISSIGDVRVMARYFGFNEQKNLGLQIGLKLPTGRINQLANDGVTAVDPGLQLGTGTTDLMLGAYFHNNINSNWGYFSQALYQTALNRSQMAAGAYKPGSSLNLNFGLRYEGMESVTPTLQINTRFVQRDGGAAADSYATGGTLMYATPGFSVPMSKTATFYTSVQLPIYQKVNGIQLTPSFIFSAGVRASF